MYDDIEVEAESLDAAIEIAMNAPLPIQGEYVDGGFEVNEQCLYALYPAEMDSKKPKTNDGCWIPHFECSVCGEISSSKAIECPFCHSNMKNHDRVISLCEKRNRDKCSYYCDGFDVTCDDYEPCE